MEKRWTVGSVRAAAWDSDSLVSQPAVTFCFSEAWEQAPALSCALGFLLDACLGRDQNWRHLDRSWYVATVTEPRPRSPGEPLGM